jgi:hypothetical protein
MAAAGRIVMMMFAYGLASIAASAVFTLGTLNPHWDDVTAAGFPPLAEWAIIAVGAAIIGSMAFLPALAIVAIGETFALRSVLFYATLGGALALALSYGFDLTGDFSEPDAFFSHEREVFAASGIAGGLVYWLFAGRRAGAWIKNA